MNYRRDKSNRYSSLHSMSSTAVSQVSEQNASAATRGPSIVSARRSTRLPSLDVAKGTLVLVMVLYHWLNYFIGLQTGVYRYLRFLTPSFIFVSGFLVARVYLPRFARGERYVARRLIYRGLKLLALVFVLNVITNVAGGAFRARLTLSPGVFLVDYLTGSAPVAFCVLIPIGYLLIFCGLVLLLADGQALFPIACLALICGAEFCELRGKSNGYLEVFSTGMCGVVAGRIPLVDLKRRIDCGAALLAAYLVYVWGLRVWNASYALQLIGVCLNIALICWLAGRVRDTSLLKQFLIRLGEYSLFAYIAQIVILQCIRTWGGITGTRVAPLAVALVAAIAMTAASVYTMHWATRRLPVVDRVYRAMFG